ncbi:hypothetical protein FHT85_005836 [Rhizobium sp. BK312]|nr:hypothetical protein [Rhizobium sp. BK312]
MESAVCECQSLTVAIALSSRTEKSCKNLALLQGSAYASAVDCES